MSSVQKRVQITKRKRRVLPLTKGTRALLSGFDKLKPDQRAYLLDQVLKQAGPQWRHVFGLYLQAALES